MVENAGDEKRAPTGKGPQLTGDFGATSQKCVHCASQIPAEANICASCQGAQDWRRYLNVSNTFLALMIALISVSASAWLVVREAIYPPEPNLNVSSAISQNGLIHVYVQNTGEAMGVLSPEGQLAVGLRSKDGRWEDIILFSESLRIHNAADSFVEPGARNIPFQPIVYDSRASWIVKNRVLDLQMFHVNGFKQYIEEEFDAEAASDLNAFFEKWLFPKAVEERDNQVIRNADLEQEVFVELTLSMLNDDKTKQQFFVEIEPEEVRSLYYPLVKECSPTWEKGGNSDTACSGDHAIWRMVRLFEGMVQIANSSS